MRVAYNTISRSPTVDRMSCWILLLGSLFIIVASRVKVTLASDTFSSVAELENLYEKEQLVGRRLQDLLNDVVHPSEDNPIKEYKAY